MGLEARFRLFRPFEAQKSGIEFTHPAVRFLEERGKIESFHPRSISLSTLYQVTDIITRLFPEHLQPAEYRHLNPDQLGKECILPTTQLPPMLQFRTFAFTPSEATGAERNRQPTKPDVGVIFLPGVLGSHASAIPTLAEFVKATRRPGSDYQDDKPDLPFDIKLLASLDSSVSQQTLSQRFSKNPIARIAAMIPCITELLRNNPCGQTFIFAHSLAGFEAAYLLPILEEYLEMNEAETKLSLILVQAGGQYDQSAIKFALWKAPLWNLFLDEIRELYPLINAPQFSFD